MPAYSTVTIDSVEFQNADGILNPVPLGPLGLLMEGTPEGKVNPQELPTSEEPPVITQPAFVIAIHATDPLVGPDPPKGPGGEQAPPSQALSNIIGLQVRQAGSYDDIEVPVFQTPQVFGTDPPSLQQDQTFPPNPQGDADVAATLWYFQQPDSGDLPPFVPAPITDDGTPIQGTATITELDQNTNLSPVSPES